MTTAISSQAHIALLQAKGPDLNSTRDRLQELVSNNNNDGQIKNMKAIEEAAKDFEAVFLTEMLKPMFEGIEVDSTFGGGKGEEVFRGFMLQEYGKIMVEAGGVGIAEQVKAEMIKIQEETNHD